MIKVDISAAVAFYMILWVFSLFIFWIFFGRGPKFKSYTQDKRFIWQCAICLCTYVDSKSDTISKCPECGSYNKREPGFGID